MDLEAEIEYVIEASRATKWHFNEAAWKPRYTDDELHDMLNKLLRQCTQYHQAEIDYWKQMCEETEIDLMLEENKILKFNTPGTSIKRKMRRNFT
jgi:hypothetical protein